MDYEEGAGVPEAFLTAYQALYLVADLKKRARAGKPVVLVHGGAGGVGNALIQLAASKAKVFSPKKCVNKVIGKHLRGDFF